MYKTGDIVELQGRLYTWENFVKDRRFSMIRSIYDQKNVLNETKFTLAATDDLKKVSNFISDY